MAPLPENRFPDYAFLAELKEQWQGRELADKPKLGYGVLALVLIMAALFIAAGVTGVLDEKADLKSRIALGLIGAAAAWGAWFFSRMSMRGIRYGTTNCRMLTVPAVIGGWLKAEVTCRLPAPADVRGPVRVGLVNTVSTGTGKAFSTSTCWRMEQELDAKPIPVPGTDRSILRVQLRIPAEPGQKPLVAPRELAQANREMRSWKLEIRQRTASVDLFASFYIPVCTQEYGDQAEQSPFAA